MSDEAHNIRFIELDIFLSKFIIKNDEKDDQMQLSNR